DVVDDRLGDRDFTVFGAAAWLEAHVAELLYEVADRDAVLQCERNRGREGVHHAGDRAAFLRHRDKDLAGRSIFVEPDVQIPFVTFDAELVSDRVARVR